MNDLKIVGIWRNARKRALINMSANTIQARPGNLGYGADGAGMCWAVLDAGIRSHDHPHFQKHGNVVAQWDCTKTGDPLKLLPGSKQFDELDGDGSRDARRRDHRGRRLGRRRGLCGHGATRLAVRIQGAERSRRGRGCLDHQGARQGGEPQREGRLPGGPGRQSQSRRWLSIPASSAAVTRRSAGSFDGCGGRAFSSCSPPAMKAMRC